MTRTRRPLILLRTGILLLAALGVLGLSGCLAVRVTRAVQQNSALDALPAKGDVDSASERTLYQDGTARSYLVQVPSGPGPFPVVVLLHGGTQTARETWEQTSLPSLAREKGYLMVAPQGVNKHWNDGRGVTIAGEASGADDVAFLNAVIDDVLRRDHGDASAVFMVGASNGGFMTMYYACQSAQRLRAAASVISNLPSTLAAQCRPPKPLPWLAINGTDDPIIPYGGQATGKLENGVAQPALLSAEATFDFWADHAGCSEKLDTRTVTGSGDTRVETRTREKCTGGNRSVQYVIHGAGHVWPGLAIRMPMIERRLGGTNLTVDSGEIVWDFFASTLNH
ncbi:MAG: alpha/beta fold hydrolase [Gammaproteobacteria bacterium]|nr:alpha/beta fold hydrolase [Gammaproteobacteria bacterium]